MTSQSASYFSVQVSLCQHYLGVIAQTQKHSNLNSEFSVCSKAKAYFHPRFLANCCVGTHYVTRYDRLLCYLFLPGQKQCCQDFDLTKKCDMIGNAMPRTNQYTCTCTFVYRLIRGIALSWERAFSCNPVLHFI